MTVKAFFLVCVELGAYFLKNLGKMISVILDGDNKD